MWIRRREYEELKYSIRELETKLERLEYNVDELQKQCNRLDATVDYMHRQGRHPSKRTLHG